MNKTFLGLLTLAAMITAAPLSAQSMDHAKDHHGESGWKELDAFHTLMAATWHPAKSNDLKPIRAKADSLSLAAQVWSKSKVPAACDTEPLKTAIADVVAGSARVEQLVAKSAADADLRAALHDVHERFEVVEKGCKPAKHH
jgi:hypothetical protein